jgi:hypothetical protein
MKYLLGFLGGVIVATTVSVGAQWVPSHQPSFKSQGQLQGEQQQAIQQGLQNRDLLQGRNPFGPRNPC